MINGAYLKNPQKREIEGGMIKMNIENELKNFIEDHKTEMSVNVYNGFWDIIQSIEHDKKE